MSVLVLGLNYRNAPVGLLERLAVASEGLPKALHSLTSREHIGEAVVLSTCNRVEVYAAVSRYHGGVADLRNFFAEWGGVELDELASVVYDLYDDRAAAHLFAVASGLDSMVVGERQIHLQVRQAFKDAQAHGSAGRMLDGMFRQALRVGRRVREETEVSQGGATMVDAGLQAAERVLGDLGGTSVLLVGAGKMGGMTGRRLSGRAADLTVVNRNPARAERLAERVEATALPMSALPEALVGADLVITSADATMPLVGEDDVAEAMRRRDGRALVLLDLAVPRNVEPGCASVPGVTVLDIDGIRELSAAGATGAVVAQAREIVEEEAAGFASWTRTMGVEPVISALRTRAEEVRAAEVERVAGKLTGLDDRQRAAVEALSKSIVATLLHEPTVRLKQVADQRGADGHAALLQELFDLDDPEGP